MIEKIGANPGDVSEHVDTVEGDTPEGREKALQEMSDVAGEAAESKEEGDILTEEIEGYSGTGKVVSDPNQKRVFGQIVDELQYDKELQIDEEQAKLTKLERKLGIVEDGDKPLSDQERKDAESVSRAITDAQKEETQPSDQEDSGDEHDKEQSAA